MPCVLDLLDLLATRLDLYNIVIILHVSFFFLLKLTEGHHYCHSHVIHYIIVPTKVDPKAMFAVERTFFQWMHTSLWLLTASLTIISYSGNDPIKLMYGAFIMPVALAFTIYALIQCKWYIYGSFACGDYMYESCMYEYSM